MSITVTDVLMATLLALLIATSALRALGHAVAGESWTVSSALVVVSQVASAQSGLPDVSWAMIWTIVKEAITIIVLVLGGVLAVFFFVQFSYPLTLKLESGWLDDAKELLILRIQVESKAKVRIHAPIIELQSLEYRVSRNGATDFVIPERVPFSELSYKKMISGPRPIAWRQPRRIFRSTVRINPGEIVAGELLYCCPKDTVLHVGMKVSARRSFFDRLATGRKRYSQTTTHIVSRAS